MKADEAADCAGPQVGPRRLEVLSSSAGLLWSAQLTMARAFASHLRCRHRRRARLQQLGRGRHDDGVGQAAAWPTTRISARRFRRSGISRTCPPATSTSSARRCPARRRSPIGRNRFIAWGETNVMGRRAGSVSRTPRRRPARTPSFAALRSRCRSSTETIAVKGAAPDDAVDVRISRHGPLISDAINANNAASTRVPRTGAARAARVQLDGARPRRSRPSRRSCSLNQARNWTEFTAALARLRRARAELRVRRR